MSETDPTGGMPAPKKKRVQRVSEKKARERGARISASQARKQLANVTEARQKVLVFRAALKRAVADIRRQAETFDASAAKIERDIQQILNVATGKDRTGDALNATKLDRERLYADPFFKNIIQPVMHVRLELDGVENDGWVEPETAEDEDTEARDTAPRNARALSQEPRERTQAAANPFFRWVESRRLVLVRDPEAERGVHLKFPAVKIPLIEIAGAWQEGRYENGVLVSAHAARPYNSEPVRMFIGVPGGGKTYAAMEFLGQTPGEITALAATIGADKQIKALADKLGLQDRVTIVDSPSELRGEKRVLLDEAGRMDAKALQCLDACEILAVSGDIGQTRTSQGESVLGVLAALGAPIEVRETSRRTGDPSIKLLGSFVSSQYAAEITTNERILFARSSIMRSDIANPGEGSIDAIVREVERSPSYVVVVWSRDVVVALKDRGVVAYVGDEAQGIEADTAIVHLPLSWGNRSQYPELPSVSLINAVCRARKKAILLSEFRMSDRGAALNGDNSRWIEIDRLIRLVSSDPRRSRGASIHPFTDDHWSFVAALDNVLGRRARLVDVVGESLLICSSRAPKAYQAAIVLRPTRFSISVEAFQKAGFPYVFPVDLEEVRAACRSYAELESWVGKTFEQFLEMDFEAFF